jgi:hypothetical protein
MEKLPIYKITIDPEYAGEGEDLGIDMIAFTATPAILTKGVAFSATGKKVSFKDETKARIAAPAMIPGEIYRSDEWGEYYVQFSKEEIEKLHSKFMRNLSNKNIFNIEHDGSQVAPAYVLEAWLVGKDNLADRSYSEFGIEVPEGSLFMVAQVTDNEYFQELVKEEKTGFSIEGILGMKLSNIPKQKLSMKKEDLKKMKRYSAEFAEAGVDETSMLTIVGESIEPGQKVIVIDETLAPVEGWTGEVTIEGYEKVKIEDGVITEITETESEEFAEISEEEETAPAEETSAEEESTSTYAITPEEQTLIVTEVMTILESKFEEIYSMIAEIKSALKPVEEETVVEEAPVAMSFAQKFVEVSRFLQKPTIN